MRPEKLIRTSGPHLPVRPQTVSTPRLILPGSPAGQRFEMPELYPRPRIVLTGLEGLNQRTEEVLKAAPAPTPTPARIPAAEPARSNNTENAALRTTNMRKMMAASSLVALVATLIPKAVLGSTLGGPLGGIAASLAASPLGLAALAGGGLLLLAFYTKHLFGFDRTMSERNGNPGDPCLRKLLTTFAAVPAALITGSTLLYFATLLLPWGATPTFLALGGAGLLYGTYATAKSIVTSRRISRQTITPGAKANLRAVLETAIFSHAVQGTEAAYMFYRSATVGTLLFGVLGTFYTGFHAAIATTGLTSLLAGAAPISLPLFIGLSLYLRFASRKWNELQHPYGQLYNLTTYRGIRNVVLAAAGCALAGTVLFYFPAMLLNTVLALAFVAVETHALIHNWGTQRGSRKVIETPVREFSDREYWQAGRRKDSPWITVQKPSLSPPEFAEPIYATFYLRKGTFWDFLNITSGAGAHGDSRETMETLRFMQSREDAVLAIIDRARAAIGALPAGDLTGRYEQLALMYEALADHWSHAATGDFTGLRVSDVANQTNVFVGPGADNFERYLGQLIAHEGNKFRDQAADLRHRRAMSAEEISEHLDCLEHQYSPIFHYFSTSQFRNTSPDVRRAKIRKIDLVNQMMATFRTGTSILRKNRRTGKYYWEIIPCKRVRELDTRTNTLSWTTRSSATMNRFLRRDPSERYQTYSDIGYADNTGMPDPVGRAHTEAAYTYGPMREGNSWTLAFKNGRCETFTMRGGNIVRDDHGQPRDPNSEDEVVWVPGMPIPAGLADKLPKNWKDKDGKVHEEYIAPRLYHCFAARYQTMLDGEHADIQTSNYTARMEQDLREANIGVIWSVPEEITVPSAQHLRERTTDRLVRISSSLATFGLRVRETSGRVLYIPYDWKKCRLITNNFWVNIHHVELMSRADFCQRFGVKTCTDNHGDKHDYVIAAFDAAGHKLGGENEALPYSYYLQSPEHYQSVEFDRANGRVGDNNYVAYTFMRDDGSRYLRWLPKENDWPEMDFDERGQSFEFHGSSITLRSRRWIGKKYTFDPQRLVIDPGCHDNPNFEVTGIYHNPRPFLRSIGARNRCVVARYHRNGDGSLRDISYHPYHGRSVHLDDVVDQARVGTSGAVRLTHLTTEDKHVVPIGTEAQLQHPSNWIASAAVAPHPTDRDQVRLTVTFVNPYNGQNVGTQEIDLDRRCLPNVDDIYRSGNNCEFLPRIFDQRQRDRATGRIERRLFLVVHTCRQETVDLGLAAGEEAKLIEAKSSLRVRLLNNVNGHPAGTEIEVPFDKEIPRASCSRIWFDPDGEPFNSGLKFGRLDTIVGPQHLVPVQGVRGGIIDDLIRAPLLGEGNGGAEYATDEQKGYFAERAGEYHYGDGWVAARQMPCLGSEGPVGIQYAKSIDGAALNTGSNTLKRSPDMQHLLFQREELELYAEDGMPVPMLKSLFDPPTITEDAQSAWEAARMLDEGTENWPDVNTVGKSVDHEGQAAGQRMRWAGMVKFLVRIKKMVYDEIVRARLLKQIPPQYTNAQLLAWFQTFSWFLDTVGKHVIPLISFAYMLGFTALPAGAVVFPLFWTLKTVFGWPKYSLDNQRIGVSRTRSYFRNLALYYLQIPSISQSVSHIIDEGGGPFQTLFGSRGRTYFRTSLRKITYYFGGVSGVTTAIGLFRLATCGLSTFGLIMNVIWPAMMFAGVVYALRMSWNGMKRRLCTDNGYRRNIANAVNCTPQQVTNWVMFKHEFLKPLTVEWFSELGESVRNAYRYYTRGAY